MAADDVICWSHCLCPTKLSFICIALQNLSPSLSHTHNYQIDLVGHSIWLDQLDGTKTDLQTARFFELGSPDTIL
jgi:hypothetical protein